MNRYTEMKRRRQEEFNAIPLGFAFNNAQFDEVMHGLGLETSKRFTASPEAALCRRSITITNMKSLAERLLKAIIQMAKMGRGGAWNDSV